MSLNTVWTDHRSSSHLLSSVFSFFLVSAFVGFSHLLATHILTAPTRLFRPFFYLNFRAIRNRWHSLRPLPYNEWKNNANKITWIRRWIDGHTGCPAHTPCIEKVPADSVGWSCRSIEHRPIRHTPSTVRIGSSGRQQRWIGRGKQNIKLVHQFYLLFTSISILFRWQRVLLGRSARWVIVPPTATTGFHSLILVASSFSLLIWKKF